jgi:hypothetical protein
MNQAGIIWFLGWLANLNKPLGFVPHPNLASSNISTTSEDFDLAHPRFLLAYVLLGARE